MLRRLEPKLLVDTAGRLRQRIEERFPQSGLARLAAEIEAVTREASRLSEWLAQPMYALRVLAGVAIACLLALGVTGLVRLHSELGTGSWSDWVQGIEALINDVVFMAIAIYFLVGLETRRKRTRALAALRVLRSLAHIVDLHQLTKDPERLGSGMDTASSPTRTLTAFQLTRYLDYSTELLAVLSKVAALYVQELGDPITAAAASDVEELTVSLSRTIWQKIMILDRVVSSSAAHEAIEPR